MIILHSNKSLEGYHFFFHYGDKINSGFPTGFNSGTAFFLWRHETGKGVSHDAGSSDVTWNFVFVGRVWADTAADVWADWVYSSSQMGAAVFDKW